MSRNPYFKRNYFRRLGVEPSPVVSCPPTDFCEGVKTLSQQIASFRAGGLGSGQRPLEESVYDEDDVEDIDPSSEFGLDRFEKSEAIAATISDRMAKKHKQKLDEAKV